MQSDGVSASKRRREKEIRFISAADTAAEDAAASAARIYPAEESGRCEDSSGPSTPPTAIMSRTTSSFNKVKREAKLAGEPAGSSPVLASRATAAADGDEEVGSPLGKASVVVSGDDIDFSHFTGLSRTAPASLATAAAKRSTHLSRQRHRKGRKFRRNRGEWEGGKGKRAVGVNPFAQHRRGSTSSNSSTASGPKASAGDGQMGSIAGVAQNRKETVMAPRSPGGEPAHPFHPATASQSPAGGDAEAGLLAATALLFAAAETEAKRGGRGWSAQPLRDSTVAARGGSDNGDGAGGRGGAAVSLAAPATAVRLQRQQQAQDSYYVRKHMQSIAQAKQSQKQLHEFREVLKHMEEEALRARRKVRQRTPTASSAAGGGMAMGDDGVADGDAGLDQGDEAEDESFGREDVFDEEELDDEDDEHAGGADDGVGLMYLGDESTTAGKRYTPLARRQQPQKASGGATLGQPLTNAQQQRILRRQIVAAERYLREHPEMESTLRAEIVQSESRLFAARTVRADDAKATTRTAEGDTDAVHHSCDTAAHSQDERVDWRGLAAAEDGAARSRDDGEGRWREGGSAESSAVDTAPLGAPERERGEAHHGEEEGHPLAVVPSDEGHESSPALASHDAPQQTSVGERRDSLRSVLSPSLRNLSDEDKLAELLERGNGRCIYGTEGSRPPARYTRPHATPKGKASALAADSPTCRSPAKKATTPAPSTEANTPAKTEAAVHANVKMLDRNRDGCTAAVATPAEKAVRRVTFANPKDTPGCGSLSSTPPVGPPSHVRKPSGTAATAAQAAGAREKAQKKRAPFTTRKSASRKKTHDALPVVVGVGDRAAEGLQTERMRAHVEELEAHMTVAKDTRRTCELLDRLRPMREALIHRDILGVYRVSDPQTWSEKYPRRSEPVALPRITQRAHPLPEQQEQPSSETQLASTEFQHDPAGSVRGAAGKDVVSAAVLAAHDQRRFANPAETLERHRKLVFATAFTLDEEKRRKSRLLYVDVLEAMSERHISRATWPSAQAALAHARDILLHEPKEHQSFVGFQAIVHKHFSLLQLIQWPVQQMLEHLSALFLMSSREYKEWLANLYQKLSNSHDYEARFRAVDRTVKEKDIPEEAQVRLILHACRRLPRTFLMDLPAAGMPSRLSHHSAPAGDTAGAAASVTSSSLTATAFKGTLTPSSVAPLVSLVGAPVHHVLEDRTRAADASQSAFSLAPFANATASHGPMGSVNRDSTSSTIVDPFSASSSSVYAKRMAALTAPVSAEPEYAIRIEAERQVITSSAVPASSAERGRTGGKDAGKNSAASAAAAAAGKNVNFYNQTFKLHLYDASSAIRIILMKDGLPLAKGTFSVQRYGNGKKIQLWLPLTLVRPKAGTEGPHGGGRTAIKTEVKMTVEVL